MTLLERVSAVLERAGVPHAVIGAAALAAAGVARSTFDVDLLVVSDLVLHESTWAALEDARVDIRRGDPDDPLRGVVRIEADPERPVDIIVGKHAWQAQAIERAAPSGTGPAVVLPRDLVLLKLYAGGTQDMWDIRELLRACGEPLARAVDDDLTALPADMRARWTESRS